MATSFTSLLGLALPVTGELAGTWGDVVNNSITTLLDAAVAGTTTLSTDADVTLTTTTGATNQSRQAILLCTGTRSVLRTITAPARSKMYVVINSTTGGFGVKIVGVGPTTGVTVAAGKTAVVVWNGADFVEVAPATATTATNLAGGVAGSLPYQTAASTTTFLGIGANNFVLTSNGSAPVWTTNTGTGNVVRATSPALTTPTVSGDLQIVNSNAVIWGLNSATNYLQLYNSGTNGVNLASSTSISLLTNGSTRLSISSTGLVNVTGLTASQAVFTDASKNLVSVATTGSGSVVLATSPTIATPTFTTSATFPLHIGGTGTTSTLALRSTSGIGATGADIIFQVGNNGATEAMRVLNNGNVGIGTNAPGALLHVQQTLANTYAATSAIDAAPIGSLTSIVNLAQAADVFRGINFSSRSAAGDVQNAYFGAVSTATGNSPIFVWGQRTGATAYAERMRIDSSGVALLNTTLASNVRGNQKLSVVSAGAGLYGGASFTTYGGTASDICSLVDFQRSRSTGDGSLTQVVSGDALGYLTWRGSDGSAFQNAAGIRADVDGIPGTGDMPGRLVFMTSPDGTATLTERMRITNAGDIGIGTTTPNFILQVNEANSAGVGGQVNIKNSAARAIGNSARVSFSPNSDYNSSSNIGAYLEGLDTTGTVTNNCSLVFGTGSAGSPAERMRIDHAGNVGIGTSTPGTFVQATKTQNADTIISVVNLDTGVAAAAAVQAASDSSSVTLAAYGSGFTPAGVRLASSGALFTSAAATGGLSIGARNAAGVIRFSTVGDTERMRIDSAGNVLVGTTTAAATLSVESSTGISTRRNNTGNGEAPAYILIGRSKGATSGSVTALASGDWIGSLQFVGADGTSFVSGARVSAIVDNTVSTGNMPTALVFGTNASGIGAPTERMRIDSAGNVGIGTATPGYKLDVQGATAISGNLTVADTYSLLMATGSEQKILAGGTANSTYLTFNQWVSGSYLERMRIDGSGYVRTAEKGTTLFGIDTATGLGVGGSLTIKAGGGFGAGNASGNLFLAAGRGASTATNGYIAFGRAQATNIPGLDTAGEFMRIDSAGKVLVGATTARANYNNATFSPRMQIEGTDSTGSSLAITCNNASDADGPILYFGKSATATVGSNTLVANGELLGIVVFAGNDGTEFVSAAQIKAEVDGTPGANDMPGRLVFSTTADGAAAVTERMRIDSVGNVGIGTGTPLRALHVASNNATAFFDRDGGSPAAISLRSSRGSLATPTQTLANDTLGVVNAFGYTNAAAYSSTGRAALWFYAAENFTSAAQGAYLTLETTPTGTAIAAERLRITSEGNVGIGTATPVNALQINGSLGRTAPVTKAASFTLAATENWLICNGTATITVTLPAASSWTGREVMIKNIAAFTVVSASSNVVPLAGGAAGTAILAATAGVWATLVSDGTNWIIMQA